MRKTNFRIPLSVAGFLLFFVWINFAVAQLNPLMVNNGCTIMITPPTTGNSPVILHINGGFENRSAGANYAGMLTNHGQMWVRRNSPQVPDLTGSIWLRNESVTQGNGLYYVEQDWINDATFKCDESTVTLDGNLQEFITGYNETTFHNLTLTGFGGDINSCKTMTLNSRINSTGILSLHDRELQTKEFKMTVENTSLSAINKDPIQTGGFVSSDKNGELIRRTNTNAPYLFPTGSSGGILHRYRPIELTPDRTDYSSFGVRFVNNFADDDGLSTKNGAVPGIANQFNPFFYHTLTRTDEINNATLADIAIHYDNAGDAGPYDAIWFWDAGQQMWRNSLNSAVGPVTQFTFASEVRPGWGFLRPEDKHFILGREDSGITDSIPNIFTPNDDGFNDIFHVNNQNMKEYQFLVYNRWGVLLYETTSAQIDWDGKTLAGKDVPDGTYFYILSGTKLSDEKITKKGFFMLER